MAAFRSALIEDKRMCLCGMLGAEIDVLPTRVAAEVKAFFQSNINWLADAYHLLGETGIAQTKAMQTLSLLEGAMITAKVMGDVSVFDSASRALLN